MASLEELRTEIGRAAASCERAINSTQAVRVKVSDTLMAARATTHDSSHPKVVEGLARLDEAHREVERVLRLLRSSTEAAREYRQSLG
jgi:hypothetical protein